MANSRRLTSGARGPLWVGDGRGSIILAIMVWVLVIYLVVPTGYFAGEIPDYGNVAQTGMDAPAPVVQSMSAPNPVARAIKLTLLAFSTVIVLWRAKLALLVLRSLNPFFLLFLGLVIVSSLWSIDQSATIARFISLISIAQVCFAFTLVSWYPTRFQSVLRPVLTFMLVASIVFGLLYPDLAIEIGEKELKDAWRGLTTQKNQFGELASIGALFWIHALLTREKNWLVALLGAGVAFVCVALSRSSTALLSTSFVTCFMLLLLKAPSNLRRFMPYIVATFALVVVIYALAVLNIVPGLSLLLTPIAEFAGKDLTFSNRAEIWEIIKEHIQLAPLLGSGYGAYWTGSQNSPSIVFLSRMYFYPSESHNGYLEIVNELGFVGLICLLGYLTYFVRQSLQVMKVDRNQGVLFLAIFFQQAITNLSESTWLAINSVFAIAIVTFATFALSRSLLDFRLKQYFMRNPAS